MRHVGASHLAGGVGVNVYGQVVTVLLTVGGVFMVLAILRGHIDGAAVIAATLILLALFTTVWTATNRKRNHS